MKLIVGLGNPGREYADTRHNLGYRLVDVLAGRWGIDVSKRKFEGRCGAGHVGGEPVMLLKPTTYMNRSGQSVAAACGFYKAAPGDVMIGLDDLDLPLGQIRVRRGGGAGGHRGLADALRQLASEAVPRVRIGIGRPRGPGAIDHVLSRFTPAEAEAVAGAVERAADAVAMWLERGIEAAMNEYNAPASEPPGR